MKNRFLVIFISIFLAVVLTFGGVLGLISILKNARAVVKYDGVYIDRGSAVYLASYYKLQYIRALRLSGVDAKDTDSFWKSTDESGKTYSELFSESFCEYVASIAVANALFSSYSSYTSLDKKTVTQSCEEILKYHAADSVSTFNDKCEKYGFDYNDFLNAAELIYKAQRAEDVIYGRDGSNLSNFPEECEKYLSTYSHVSLLFIRTEDVLVRDEEGNIIYDDAGNPTVRPLIDEEKAERAETMAVLDAAIEAKKNGADGQITPQMFDLYLKKSDGDPGMYEKGYYFHSSAETTAEFSLEFPEIVEASLSMSENEYTRVDCSIGVCYIYKYPVASEAYADSENLFFSDFFSDAADYLYGEALYELSSEVTIKSEFYEIDFVNIPVIENFYVKEWKKSK